MTGNEFTLTYELVHLLSNEYSIPDVDIILIALNRYGLCAALPDKRIRFKLAPAMCDEVFYLAVCVNTMDSPFTIGKDNKLCLDGVEVGQIFDIEKDTCDASYFRRNKRELTLNSNMRSQCQGCTFCGTYKLDPEDRVDMSNDSKIAEFVEGYMKKNKVKDLSNLLRVTICTGCFADEMSLVNHIIAVYRVFCNYGFSKRIHYIGSQIRSDKAMSTIAQAIPYFSLSLTVECFSNREARMRKEKASMDMQMIQEILSKSISYHFSTKYLYIVGLDELSVMEHGILSLANSVNRLPLFQIMQNYIEEHEYERAPEAQQLSYYLKARKLIEAIFENSDVSPRSWENYRGLFYTQYQNQPFKCTRI